MPPLRFECFSPDQVQSPPHPQSVDVGEGKSHPLGVQKCWCCRTGCLWNKAWGVSCRGHSSVDTVLMAAGPRRAACLLGSSGYGAAQCPGWLGTTWSERTHLASGFPGAPFPGLCFHEASVTRTPHLGTESGMWLCGQP